MLKALNASRTTYKQTRAANLKSLIADEFAS